MVLWTCFRESFSGDRDRSGTDEVSPKKGSLVFCPLNEFSWRPLALFVLSERGFSLCRDFTRENAGRPTTATAGSGLLGGQDSPLNKVQNVTQNLTGRVSALTRGVGGLANKFSGLGGFF